MTDIPVCFICKYFNTSKNSCKKYGNIDKILNGQDICNSYEYKDAK